MGLGKGTGISAAAIVAIGLGAYFYMSQDEGPSSRAPASSSPAPPAVAVLPGESLIPPQTTPRKYQDWDEMAREYIAQHPENTGFAKLLDAENAISMKTTYEQGQALNAVLKSGWGVATPQLDAAIRANTAALDAAFTAAQSAPFDMPPDTDFTTPVPNSLVTQTLFKMMLATAQMVEASGDLNQAVQRAVWTAQLAESFQSRRGFLISHLIGISGTSLSAKTLAAILKNPALPPQSAEWALASLKDLESKRHGYAEGVRGEGEIMIASVRRLKTDPEARKQLKDAGMALNADAIKSLPAYEHEADRVYRAMAANFEKPYYQRSKSVPTSDSLLPGVAQPNLLEGAIRADSALAWLRLCEALATLRAGQTDTAAIRDPFADQPVTVAADRVYSLGPDRTDQQGSLVYDPTNGTLSPGDIVAGR